MSTIVSISTAPGIGGIGIIRMSGEKSFEILDKIFKPKTSQKIEDIKGYTIKYGHIVENNEIIDEVLVSYFKAPRSYTTENMCEINSHGGNVVVKKILEICLKNGAELAEPGEFTKRAFLNGRIDLAQAESVIDVINAKSDKEAKSGIKQLEGYLSKEIKGIKQEILDVLVNIEVTIDYPEYDTPEVQEKEIAQMLESVGKKLKKLEKSFDNGKIVKDGIKTAIIGKPNAGKSSLLNAILKEDRAIVTDIAGTTRDTIEEFVTINGIPLNLVDTAGIREASDEVEKIGVEKSIKQANDADLIIAIFDSSKDLEEEDIEILNLIKGKKSIILLNKSDLNSKINENDDRFTSITENILRISALNKYGIDELYEKIAELFNLNEINLDNEILITNIRHKNIISKSLENVNKAKEALEINMPIDIITIYIKEILEDLGEITGEVVTEDIINEIFSKFCLGK
ncbi:MAG: tRNA uridine-5-carboxymethylaminomethyl(34) synthesis GTPase MnmE [Clostridium sp. 28_12]|nr:MAG: tRNA uridine-5-carboxymethylaminomethyl(34) synthesis GTPase MnmE [Clostridium sp. 28_12]